MKLFGEGLSIVREDTGTIKGQMDVMFKELSGQRIEITHIKSDITIIKKDVSTLKTDMTAVKNKLNMVYTEAGRQREDMFDHNQRLLKVEGIVLR